jgi:hypothetical protein
MTPQIQFFSHLLVRHVTFGKFVCQKIENFVGNSVLQSFMTFNMKKFYIIQYKTFILHENAILCAKELSSNLEKYKFYIMWHETIIVTEILERSLLLKN